MRRIKNCTNCCETNLNNKYDLKTITKESLHSDPDMIPCLDQSNDQNLTPSDYSYCLIANHIYCFQKLNIKDLSTQLKDNKIINEISGFSYKSNKQPVDSLNTIEQDDHIHSDNCWQILTEQNWIIYEILRSIGFKSIVYSNETKKQIVLAFQGMKFNLNDYLLDEFNVLTYIKLISNHSNTLYFHIKKCIELSKRTNYNLSFTGYSFGALLAQLSVFISHKYFQFTQVSAVTFESFGSLNMLNELNKDNPIDLNDLNLKTFLLKPNFFNTIEEHCGRMFYLPNDCYQLEENIPFTKALNSIPKLNEFYQNGYESLCSINLKYQLKILKNKTELNEIIKWPSNYTINFHDRTNYHNSTIDLVEENETIKRITYFNLKYLQRITEIIKRFKNEKLELQKELFILKDHQLMHRRDPLLDDPPKRLVDKLNKEFLELCDHLFIKNEYLDTFSAKNYDFEPLVTVIYGESGTGKLTLAVKAAQNLLNQNENLIIRIINATSRQMTCDLGKLGDELGKDLFELSFCLQIIKRPTNASFLIILHNLNNYHAFWYSIKDKFPSCTQFIITTQNRYFFENETHINRINILTFDSDSISQYFKLFTNDLKRIYQTDDETELDRRINETVQIYSTQFQRLSFVNLKILLNTLKNRPDWSLDHFNKYSTNIIHFIKEENEPALVYLKHISFLDGNCLSFDLLRNLYEIINENDTNFTNILDYLVQNSILTKIGNIKYKINNSIRSKLIEYFNLKLNEKIVLIGFVLKSLMKLLNYENVESNAIKYSILDYNIEVCYKQFMNLSNCKNMNLSYDMENRDLCFKLNKILNDNNWTFLFLNMLIELEQDDCPYKEIYYLQIKDQNNGLNELECQIIDAQDNISETLDETRRLLQLNKEELIAHYKKSQDININQEENLPIGLEQWIHETECKSEKLFEIIDKYEQKCHDSIENIIEKEEILKNINKVKDLLATVEENWLNDYYYASADVIKAKGYISHLDSLNLNEFKEIYLRANKFMFPDGEIEIRSRDNELGRIRFVEIKSPFYRMIKEPYLPVSYKSHILF